MAAETRSLAWDDFRLINAIAEARTLPAAATRLGIDHSTVFRRLRQIEAALRTQVFERHRGGYELTAAGIEIAALAARVDEDITAVLRRVAGRAPSPSGEVRIATSDALLSGLLLPLLAGLRQQCPDIRLDLVTGNLPHNLSRRDADVAIRATIAPPETLVGRKMARIGWAAYAAAHGAPAVGGDGVFAIETAWVGFGDALSGLAASALLRRHVPDQAIACRFDTVGGLAAGIATGAGIGFLPCFLGDGHPGLVQLGPAVAELQSELWLLTHADLRHTPRVRVLLDYLGDRLAALRPTIEGSTPPSRPA